MNQCVRCKNEAENTYRFAVVDSRITSENKNYIVATKTTTHIYERFSHVERTCVCNKCLKRERNIFALQGTGFAAFCVFALLAVVALKTFSISLTYLIVFGVLTLLSAIGVFIYSRVKKDVFYASDLRRNMSGKRYRYVPVEKALYCSKGQDTPDMKKFKEKTNLRTNVANMIFDRFVVPGNGDELIDSIILQSSGAAESTEADTVTLDQISKITHI